MAEILSEFGHLVGLAGGNNIQATTMPTYSSVPLGTIVQYIGTTTADYINGYFYKATATGWEQHDTQPASNADNSITAFKESSPALAAHAVDEYIRYNNVTYIVTAAIAIGDNLVIGTNIDVPDLDEGTVIYTPEAGGGSTGGGHVIVNPSGTEMEQRASLQFVDANVTDDSTNDKTKIENIKVINSESELASASDGMYMGSYDDEAEGVISADMVMYDSETTVEDELDNKVDILSKGVANGVAELDSSGKVPSSQLPSYVDDVIEGYYDSITDRFYTESTFEHVITPESGKSWVDVNTNKSYRWTGSVYTRVDEGIQLGETSGSAYRGDRGKTAYDHSQVTSGNPHNVSKTDIGLGNVDNTSDTTKKTNFTGSLVSGNTGFVTGGSVFNIYRVTHRDITNDLANLPTAVSEQNLAKYGYAIGDYFSRTVGERTYTYYLADMNPFYGGYDYYAVVATPHIGIIVNTNTNSQWYTGSDITGVSYTNSTLHQYLSGDVLNNIKADMIALFGGTTGLEHLVAHTLLDNTLGTWAWTSGGDYIAALTEHQMYGARVWSADNYQQGEGFRQLEIFRKYDPNLIYPWSHVWLRSVASAADACLLLYYGSAVSYGVPGSFLASGLILFH